MSEFTSQINIAVQTAFLPDQSNEAEKRFVFSYTITIENQSEDTVKLLSRYWQICDANGDQSTVAGEGVIGKQPTLSPNQSFTYTSGCILKTPVGTMQGHYMMINQQNTAIKVEIPVFRLAVPNILN